MSKQLKALVEFVDLVVERRVREADVSDGSRVPHGSSKHVKDLQKRIDSLTMWRDKQKRGSENRANYARVINRLKSELSAAKRAQAKKMKEGVGDPAEEAEAKERWEQLYVGNTPDDAIKAIVQAFKEAEDQGTLAKTKDATLRRVNGGLLSTTVTPGFVEWLYDKRAEEIGIASNNEPRGGDVRKLR